MIYPINDTKNILMKMTQDKMDAYALVNAQWGQLNNGLILLSVLLIISIL